MGIETIAAGAIAALGPYLVESGKSFAKKAGETLVGKVEALYASVKKRFADDADAEQALTQLENKPDSAARQASLEELLVEKMRADSEFAATLNRLLLEVQAADTTDILNLSGDRNIALQGNATNSILITGDRNRVDK